MLNTSIKRPLFYILFFALSIIWVSLFSACDKDNGTSADSDTDNSVTLTEDIETYFNSETFVSIETVDCTLTDGSSTQCYEVTFSANPHEQGPFCPETYQDIGGTTVWNGPTDPGLHAVDSNLLDALEADGYDIVDEQGNVSIAHSETDMGICLELAFDETVTKTFKIPVSPKAASSASQFRDVEDIGFSFDGIKYAEQPSSYGMRFIAVLDRCGGHVDPDGSYHWHMVSEGMNEMLEANDIDEISCSAITQKTNGLVGFAKDGFPIVGYLEEDGSNPTALDNCGGHVHKLDEYDDEIYHYHAASEGDDNLPRCLYGVPVSGPFIEVH